MLRFTAAARLGSSLGPRLASRSPLPRNLAPFAQIPSQFTASSPRPRQLSTFDNFRDKKNDGRDSHDNSLLSSLALLLGASATYALIKEASAAEGDVDPEETIILSTTEREQAINRINKLKGVEGEEESGLVVPNPFIHDTPLNFYESIKLVLGSVTLVPIRLALCVPIIFSAWALAKLALINRDSGQDALSPLSWWQRSLLRPVVGLNRALLFVIGFYWIKHHGEPAPPSAAPVVVANSSSPLDALFLVNAYGHIGFIVSPELISTPILGTLIKAHQCIVADERLGDERVQRTKLLRDRLQEGSADESRVDKPQVAIFPEGVRTNGHYLVHFRPGAFDLGVPVQPVYIDYEYSNFNPVLPLVGPSRLEWTLRLLSQVQNKVSLYFVPPLKPTHLEKENPLVFAANVRHLMARRFNLIKTESKADEVEFIAEAATLGMPPSALRTEMKSLAHISQCSVDDTMSMLRRFNAFDRTESGTLTLQEFSNFLGFPEPNQYTESLFRMLDRDESGDLNFREFVFGLSLLSQEVSSEEVIKLAFEAFDDDGNGTVSLTDLSKALRANSKHLSKADVQRMFDAMDTNSDGTISYEDFSTFVRKHPEHDLIRIAKERAVEKQPFAHLKHRRSYWRY